MLVGTSVLITIPCRSESPSQVFYILIQWLVLLHEKNELDEDIILAYDNMCNLERMRASRLPLPLEPPLDQLWIMSKL